jgi:serine protease
MVRRLFYCQIVKGCLFAAAATGCVDPEGGPDTMTDFAQTSADAASFPHAIALATIGPTSVDLLAVGTNDPFVAEQVDFGPVSPDHYKTFQWHLGFSLYGPYNDIQVAGAWQYNPGHAYLGFLDAGISTWTNTGGALDVRPPHEDLIDNFREHLSPSFGSALRAVIGTSPYGHGMHVMGLAAGRSNNLKGGSGVCRECSTILGNIAVNGITTPVITEVVQSGAQVVNLSFGYSASFSAPAALRNFVTGLAIHRDILLVAAAGNDGIGSPDYPASHASVLGVAGSAPTGLRWDERAACRQVGECASNFGGNVQLAAPALNVVSAWYSGNNFSSLLCGDALHGSLTNGGSIHPSASDTDGYGACTGTSMSAPIVSGVAGLVRSVNPLLSTAEVRAVLQNTARFTGDATLGRGVVQAQGSVLATLGVSGALQVHNRLTPLFSLYSPSAGDYLYTTVPQMASAAINDSGRRKYSSTTDPTAGAKATPYVSRTADPAVTGYGAFPDGAGQIPRAAVFAFTGPGGPTDRSNRLIPLYRLSYVADSATNPNNRDHTYTTDAAGLAAYGSVGYKLDGIEGYIFAKTATVTGTVKLLRRYNPARDDHAIFPETQLAAMQAEGYTLLSGSDWLGWVYPNVDSDGDGLIDGIEAVLGTNQFAGDTDLDGRSDAAEYPLADPPVSDPRRP